MRAALAPVLSPASSVHENFRPGPEGQERAGLQDLPRVRHHRGLSSGASSSTPARGLAARNAFSLFSLPPSKKTRGLRSRGGHVRSGGVRKEQLGGQKM